MAPFAGSDQRVTLFGQNIFPRDGDQVSMPQQTNLDGRELRPGFEDDMDCLPVSAMAIDEESEQVTGVIGIKAPELESDAATVVEIGVQVGCPFRRVYAAPPLARRHVLQIESRFLPGASR